MRTFFLVCLVPAFAMASSIYPSDIDTKLGVSTSATCTHCHATLSGGSGTVTKKFGIAMQGKGLAGGFATASLNAALDALEAAGTDSDNDGTGDVAELRVGRDPNKADAPAVDAGTTDGGMGGAGGAGGSGGTGGTAGGLEAAPTLKYGCGATVAPELFGALACAAVVVLRRRRRS